MQTFKPIILTAPGVEPVVQIDPYKVVRERMFVAGNSGSGKSQLLRLFVEQAAMQMPVFVIDPEGEWSTIRTHVPAALIGSVARGADAPADYRIAGELAMMLLKANCSAVLDLSDLERGDQARFVRCFIDGLFKIPDELRTPRLIVIDEAHRFAPESAGEAESRASVIRLMDSGRKYMLGAVLASQRFAKVAKSAIGEANVLLIGRFAQVIDRKLAAEASGLSQRSCGQFSKFAVGEFMAIGPAFSHDDAIRFRTNSETITKPPQPGTQIAPPARSGQLQKLVGRLSALRVPTVENEAAEQPVAIHDDARVAELELECARLRERVEAAERSAAADCFALTKLIQLVRGTSNAAEAIASDLCLGDGTEADPASDAPESCMRCPQPATVVRLGVGMLCADCAEEDHDIEPEATDQPASAPRRKTDASTGIGNGAARRLLVALVQSGKPLTRTRAAFLAKISPKSSTFGIAIATLRGAGFLTSAVGGKQLEATPEGVREAGAVPPMPSGSQLVDYWGSRLGTGANQRIFMVLSRSREPMSRQAVAEAANVSVTASTFGIALAKLRGLGLIVNAPGKQLAISKELR